MLKEIANRGRMIRLGETRAYEAGEGRAKVRITQLSQNSATVEVLEVFNQNRSGSRLIVGDSIIAAYYEIKEQY